MANVLNLFLAPSHVITGGSPSGSMVNNPPAGDMSLIPGLALGRGDGNPLLYSCLENSVDRGAWWATVQRVSKSWDTTERLSVHIVIIIPCIEIFVHSAGL